MDFIWNDGGRAACGFVGLAGDCVTRSIAIATGAAYREVYEKLGSATEKSPRNGVHVEIAAQYLAEREWLRHPGAWNEFNVDLLPAGIVIVHLSKQGGREQHFTTVIDRVIHDTWNPADDDGYHLISSWTSERAQSECRLPMKSAHQVRSDSQELTQSEFDKILHRLRALDRTASNSGSTEGEKHNALRMMQSLMLRHNLTRDDIVDDDNVEHVLFTRMACPVNGSRACSWEKYLAYYVTHHIFPMTQSYQSTRRNRTFFWFYGPKSDVQNALALFRELLLTIATAAQLRFGGHTRGSGASYAEGYVLGLPKGGSEPSQATQKEATDRALIQTRSLALRETANKWLADECNIRLSYTSQSGRVEHDPAARQRGKIDGAQHEVVVPSAPRRITQK